MSTDKTKQPAKRKSEEPLEAAAVSRAVHGTEVANASNLSSSGNISSNSGGLNQEGSAVVI